MANGEKERNASGTSGGGGNALTRGGKSIRKKIRASFRMKSMKKVSRIRAIIGKLLSSFCSVEALDKTGSPEKVCKS